MIRITITPKAGDVRTFTCQDGDHVAIEYFSDAAPKEIREPIEDITFILQDGNLYNPPKELIAALISAYGRKAVTDEFRKAAGWVQANQTNRKTLRGMPKFLNAWLSRNSKPINNQSQFGLLAAANEENQGF